MYDDMIKYQKLERDHESMVNRFKLRITASAQQGDSAWITAILSNKANVKRLGNGGKWSLAGRVALLLTTLADERDLLAEEYRGKLLREQVILDFLRKHAAFLVKDVHDHHEIAFELLNLRNDIQSFHKSSNDKVIFPIDTVEDLVAQVTQLDNRELVCPKGNAVFKGLAEDKFRAGERRNGALRRRWSKALAGVMHPDCETVKIWRRVVCAMVMAQFVVVPHNLSFRSSKRTVLFDLLTDVVYVLDIFVQLCSAYTENTVVETGSSSKKSPKRPPNSRRKLSFVVDTSHGIVGQQIDGGEGELTTSTVVWDRRAIALNYVKYCFVVDAVSLYPMVRGLRTCVRLHGKFLPWLCVKALASYKAMRLFKILKLFHFFQPKNIGENESTQNATCFSGRRRLFDYPRYVNALNLCLVWMLLMCTMHFLACGWHSVTGRDHWTRRYAEYRDADDVEYVNISMQWLYVMSLYESVLILMGEEVVLLRDNELIFAIVSIVICSVLLAIVFGQVGLLISTMNEQSRSFNNKMTAIHQAMSQSGLPGALQERISAYYTYLWKEHKTTDGRLTIATFLPELSPNLATEVRLFWCRDMILNVPFIRTFTFQIIQRLVRIVEVELYMPDDYIVLVGEIGHEMYFIKSGTVDLFRVDFAKVQIAASKRIDDPPAVRWRKDTVRRGLSFSRRHKIMPDIDLERQKRPLGSLRKVGVETLNQPPARENSSTKSTFLATARSTFKGVMISRHRTTFSSPGNAKSVEEESPMIEGMKTIKREQIVRSLFAGEYFGDSALLAQCRRKSTAKARTFVTCSIVTRDNYIKILQDYPEVRKESTDILKMRHGSLMEQGPTQHIPHRRASPVLRERMPGDISLCKRHLNDTLNDEALAKRLELLESRLKFLNSQVRRRVKDAIQDCVDGDAKTKKTAVTGGPTMV